MAAIFSEDSRVAGWYRVELAAIAAWVEIGRVPQAALEALQKVQPDAQRIAQLEAEQGHDVAAFVSQIQEGAGPDGRYFHLGLTSSDVVDTALACQLRDAAAQIDADCALLEHALTTQAVRHRLTPQVGRTHGVHAEPLTLGIRLANHLDEIRRARHRLAVSTQEVAVGQLSGTVGTHATVPPEVEESVCRSLGLEVAPVSTQVIARDRHASFVVALALLGSVIERLALTVRLGQITEVDELGEPFSDKQKGSSAMPHKRNPILCERLSGLARLLRGYATTSLENVPLWQERDISHSAAERVVLPDACTVADYMTILARRVVEGLRVNQTAMQRNLDHLGGIVFSQQLLTALLDQGWTRETAYRKVQGLALAAIASQGSFADLARADAEIRDALESSALEKCFDLSTYMQQIDTTFERLGLASEPPESSIAHPLVSAQMVQRRA